MAQERTQLLALNRGVISALGLSRIDLTAMAYAAEEQTNWVPRVLGSAMPRPGFRWIAGTYSVLGTYYPVTTVPFVFSEDETAIIEFAGNTLADNGWVRVVVDDEYVTRPAVTDNLVNGNFLTDLSGWTDADESGATSIWADAGSAFYGYMSLTGTGLNAAIRTQQVTVTDTGVEHALHVSVERGPVIIRVGSAAGGEQYVAETSLATGEHSLAFTPTGNFHITLSNRLEYSVLLTGCSLESAGAMLLSTLFSDGDLPYIRYAQSADVIFIACKNHQQRTILRWSDRSWSIAYYESMAGPFRNINITETSMTPSALVGNITITSSKDFFRATHVGGMIRIASAGQQVISAISAADTFTDPIRVVGADDARIFTATITGTFVATVSIQYSVGEPGSWLDLATTYAAPVVTSINDGLDNQIIYYRIGVKAAQYTSGTATCKLSIATGSISGLARIVDYNSATSVDAIVVRDFGGVTASKDWWESEWSGYRGWPSAVALFEGRLWWAGKDKIFGSISDAFYDFDDDFEGDAGPISRNIGFGPVQDIFWLLPLQRLMMGTALNAHNIAPAVIDGNSVISAMSSSDDEPLTPTNFNLKQVMPVGLYIDRSQQRLYEIVFDGLEFKGQDLNILTPDINAVGVVKIAVQVKPDIRIHCVLADGTASMLVFDRAENVRAWIKIETDGDIEDASVLPGAVEDQVYYVVQRDIDGDEVRYLEKWALESECQGGTLNKQADSFIVYSGAATTSISGLDHLEGETVVVWGGGKDLGTKVVSGGSISGLSESVTSAVVGLTYRARFKGTELGSLFEGGMNKRRRLAGMGLNMLNAHYQGLKYGPSFDVLYDMPVVADNIQQAADTIYESYYHDVFAYGGDWSADSRLHLEWNAPRPLGALQSVTLVSEG